MHHLQNHLVSLSISCVIYDTPAEVLQKTLASLSIALSYAKEKNILASSEVYLINNNPKKEAFFFDIKNSHASAFEKLIAENGHGNIGYGRANNIAIDKTTKKYHLIINPDVELSIDALYEGLLYLENNKGTGIVAPNAKNPYGKPEYLAKRDPSLLVILLRAINVKILNALFEKSLSHYIYMDIYPTNTPTEIEFASGCFMLCRTEELKKCHGFSSKYFLYFEDFDLSRKVRKTSSIYYLPRMVIIHSGGNASKKGIKHILMFLVSAVTFKLFK